MHPALTNLEVICTISSYTQHRSLPALASTCRAFKHSALNALWRDLQSVEPLVKCLPSDLFSIDEALQKPIDSKLWDTLFEYLSRVHSINITQQSIPSAIIEPLNMLMLSSPSTPVSWFPNLRKLTWHADGTHILAPVLRMALVPSMLVLHVEIPSAFDSTFFSVLSSLGTLCPHLKNLTMQIRHQSDDFKLLRQISPFVARPISQLHHLHTLSIWDAGSEVAEHVLKLRAMQSLSLDLRASLAWNEAPRFQFPGFDDLKLFKLSTATIEHASNVFRSLQVVKSKQINIDVSSHNIDETDAGLILFSSNEIATIFSFLILVRERCDHDKLERFSFRIGYSKVLRTALVDFTPLCTFPNLTHLLIEGGQLLMSDETLCRLARAWPKLQVLKMNSFIITGSTTEVPSFNGLINLLWCCPALTSLALVIDTTKSDGIDLKCPGGGRCNKRLAFLNLGNSPINNPVDVALIISGLFPYLKQVDLACWERPPMNTVAHRKADMRKWAIVNNMLCGFSIAKERSVETWSDCL